MANSVQHAIDGQYNPAKAHEYYLRTRELKGRTPASAADTKAFTPSMGKTTAKTVTRTLSAGEIAAARGKAIHMRLDSLKILLRELLRQAHDKEAKKAPAEKTADGASGPKQDRKALTAEQKKEKAAKAKVTYDKEHPQSNADQIKAVRAAIVKVEQQLRESVAKAKAIAGVQHTATGSTTSNS